VIVNGFLLPYSCDKTKQARRVPRESVSNKKFVEREYCAMYLYVRKVRCFSLAKHLPELVVGARNPSR